MVADAATGETSIASGLIPASLVSSSDFNAHLMPPPSTLAKGKARAAPGAGGTGLVGIGPGKWGKQHRREMLARARAMRAALVREVERAKVALWETTLEQGALVALGKELDKE